MFSSACASGVDDTAVPSAPATWSASVAAGRERAGRGSSPRLRFREFFFELVDALLQRRQSCCEQAHIEERDIVGGRIKRVAVTEPRGVVDFHVSKAEFLQHARGF